MQDSTAGVLTRSHLTQVIRGRAPLITSCLEGGIPDNQIQPSSIDLSIGNTFHGMYRMAVPQRNQTVEDMLAQAEYSFYKEDDEEAFLHQGYTYIVPLRESVKLPSGYSAKFSPKSSIGRVDIFVRALADGVPLFDRLPDGYRGKLYLEITPLSFRVKIKPGEKLIQMRLKAGDPRISGEEVKLLQSEKAIFLNKEGEPIGAHELDTSERGVYMHIDLDRDIIGFVSRSSADPLLISKEAEGAHDWRDYWEPIPRPRNGRLDLVPGRFYLPSTKERVCIPTNLCGDILPYDTDVGEIRTHYAGFFDPGFGGNTGTTGVLEIRGRESTYGLTDGQPICLMAFERLLPGEESAYDGNYTDPRPSLSKYFSDRYAAWETGS